MDRFLLRTVVVAWAVGGMFSLALAEPPRNPAPPAAPPAPPFQLTPQEQARVNQLLVTWEKQSNLVKLFKCKFTRWDYDRTFGPAQNNSLVAERHGEIKFRAPDNGTFKEHDMKAFDPATNKYAESPENMEHWVCDGKSIYQFVPNAKQVQVTELPPEMRGKAITEGPLPFIFGAKAATLKQRYWIKEITPREKEKTEVWLRAYPRFAQQAANFERVEVILSLPDMLPQGMQVYMPSGKQHSAYLFEEQKVNDKLRGLLDGDFLPPMTPIGWKKVITPAAPPTAEAPAPNPLNQAKRGKQSEVPMTKRQ